MRVLDRLRGGLIVSVQAWRGSALDDPHVIAAMARAAAANGAAGLRIEGIENLRNVRAQVARPIVGLIKREYPGFEPYITPTLDEVRAIVASGADIVAFDATARPRPGGVGVGDLIGQFTLPERSHSPIAPRRATRRRPRASAPTALRPRSAVTRRKRPVERCPRSPSSEKSQRCRVLPSARAESVRRRSCARRSMREPTPSSSVARSPTSIGSCASLQGPRTVFLKSKNREE